MSITDFFNNATVAVMITPIVGVVAYAIYRWWGRRDLDCWRRVQWMSAKMAYRWRRERRRYQPLVACIDDYVYILGSLRRRLAERCKWLPRAAGEAIPEIIVSVYTRQLPDDWPLWGKLIDPNTRPQTSLEEYVRGFHEFMTRTEDKGYTVRLNRVIVIDNVKTAKGRRRYRRLSLALRTNNHFATYMKFLHGDRPASARVFCTERPWPGWLADAVFYGVREPNKPLQWLWGVTTSYDAGEDLVLLRLHNGLDAKFDEHYRHGSLRLPSGITTLQQLAEAAETHPLLSNLPANLEP